MGKYSVYYKLKINYIGMTGNFIHMNYGLSH